MDVVVEGLTVARGVRLVLNGFDLRVPAGTCLIVRGANGVGKSTLLRSIAGFLAPLSGRVRLDGVSEDRDIGAYCHWLGHVNAARRGRTVRAELAFWAKFLNAGAVASGTIQHALERVGLAEFADLPAGRLSAGQQRRAALARLIVIDRPLWLLDEPTVALDNEGRALVERLIAERVATGGIVIVTTHVPIDIPGAREVTLTPVAAEAA